MPPVKMDVLNHENAAFYFMRDELYGFASTSRAGREGAACARARALERWVRHLLGVVVSIEPVAQRRWTSAGAGMWASTMDSTAILNALYRGEDVDPDELERLLRALPPRVHAIPATSSRRWPGGPSTSGSRAVPDRTLEDEAQNLLS